MPSHSQGIYPTLLYTIDVYPADLGAECYELVTRWLAVADAPSLSRREGMDRKPVVTPFPPYLDSCTTQVRCGGVLPSDRARNRHLNAATNMMVIRFCINMVTSVLATVRDQVQPIHGLRSRLSPLRRLADNDCSPG